MLQVTWSRGYKKCVRTHTHYMCGKLQTFLSISLSSGEATSKLAISTQQSKVPSQLEFSWEWLF